MLALMLCIGAATPQIAPDIPDSMQLYQATHTISLSGAATAFTLQAPANSSKRIYPQAILIDCGSAGCSVTQEKGGTAATTTAVTAVALNNTGTPVATFYRSSNAGSGTALNPVTVLANAPQLLKLTYITMRRGESSAQPYTIRIASTTATVTASVIWGER
jgi:hypothetical protein